MPLVINSFGEGHTHRGILTSWTKSITVYVEIYVVCKFCGFRGQFQDSKNLICRNLLVCNNYRLKVVQFLLSTCFENDDCVLLSKQLQHGYRRYLGPSCQQDCVLQMNPRDPYAVALQKDSITVGHIPHLISCVCMLFLKRGDKLLGKLSLSF